MWARVRARRRLIYHADPTALVDECNATIETAACPWDARRREILSIKQQGASHFFDSMNARVAMGHERRCDDSK